MPSLACHHVGNLNAVSKAYAVLIRDRAIELRKGRGVSVAEGRQVYSAGERKRRLRAAVERAVVREVNLRVSRGEVFALPGYNRSGKTTSIRTLMGLLSPTRGRAIVSGSGSLCLTPAVRARIEYVPEALRLYDWMRVYHIERLPGSDLSEAEQENLPHRQPPLQPQGIRHSGDLLSGLFLYRAAVTLLFEQSQFCQADPDST